VVPVVAGGVAAAWFLACAADGRDGYAAFGDGDAEAGGAVPSVFADAGTTDAASVVEGGVVFYAHTNTTLFRVRADEPKMPVESIGDFDCVDGGAVMTDLAVDRTGRIAGVSQRAVFVDMKVEQGVVHCGPAVTLSKSGAFYGAAFAPRGSLSATAETLVIAGADGNLYAVDDSGALTLAGHFGDVPADDGNGHDYRGTTVGKRWELSGDIVFFDNGGAPVGFATVRDCPSPPSTEGCNRTDTLVELDPKLLSTSEPKSVVRSVRGLVVRGKSCSDSSSGYGSVFGVAAYGGDVIGFARVNHNGKPDSALVVRISNDDATACLVGDRTGTTGGGWAGAGVTTLAPIESPGPK
jgi:hypothetical protein